MQRQDRSYFRHGPPEEADEDGALPSGVADVHQRLDHLEIVRDQDAAERVRPRADAAAAEALAPGPSPGPAAAPELPAPTGRREYFSGVPPCDKIAEAMRDVKLERYFLKKGDKKLGRLWVSPFASHARCQVSCYTHKECSQWVSLVEVPDLQDLRRWVAVGLHYRTAEHHLKVRTIEVLWE